MLDNLYKDAEQRMSKAVEAARNEFAAVRTGRASPALLDRLHVESYGQEMALKSMAQISTPDGRTLLITAWDKSTVPAIRKAIETSDLGLTPNVDGQNIRLSIPALTEERRKDLVKLIKKKGEEGKVAVRNVRHKVVDEIKHLLKDHKITEDENKRANEHVQKLTDKFIHEVDQLLAHKEKEIMEV